MILWHVHGESQCTGGAGEYTIVRPRDIARAVGLKSLSNDLFESLELAAATAQQDVTEQ